MITAYQIKNFKAFADSGPVEMRPITVLLGRNNSGKSSLFQPLQLIAQTLAANKPGARLVTREPHDFGAFFEYVHRGQVKADVRIDVRLASIPIDVQKLSSVRRGKTPLWSVDLHWIIGQSGHKKKQAHGVVKEIGLGLEPSSEELRNQLGPLTWQIALQPGGEPGECHFNGEVFSRDVLLWSCLPQEIALRGRAGTPFVSKHALFEQPRFLYGIDVPLRTAFEAIRIKPVRPEIPRVLHAGDTDPRASTYSGAGLLPSLYRLKVDHPGYWEEFSLYMKRWLDDALDFLTDFDVETVDSSRELFALVATDKATGARVSLADTGFGVAQVFTILVQCYFAHHGQLVLIEEPEAHLNPAAQRVLFDFIQELALSRGQQVVVETHSEHFLLRMRRRAVEQPELLEQIRVYFVERGKEQSRLTQLPLTEDGRLEHWPVGFLDEAFQESSELLKELTKRED